MWLPAFIQRIKDNQLVVLLEQSINLEHLKTMYNGNLSKIYARIEIIDPRKIRPSQRRLFWALCEDIWAWNGQPKEDLEDYFKFQYAVKTCGKEISLKDDSSTTVSDANELLNIVTDFILENGVPVKQGYELLPRDENYFLYNCCKYRKCMICGSSDGQMAHYEAVGSEGRKQADHRNKHFWCLCQKHHHEQHNLGVRSFMNKYHIKPIKLSEQTLKDLGVMTRKRMDEIDEEAEHGIN